MIKFYFWSLHAESLLPNAVRGKSLWLLFFIVKTLIHTEYFFIGNCKFFHRFSSKYRLNDNTLNFERILCSCRGHPKKTISNKIDSMSAT